MQAKTMSSLGKAGESSRNGAAKLPLEEKIFILLIETCNVEAKLNATGISALSSRSRRQAINEKAMKNLHLEDLFISKGYEGLGILKLRMIQQKTENNPKIP